MLAVSHQRSHYGAEVSIRWLACATAYQQNPLAAISCWELAAIPFSIALNVRWQCVSERNFPVGFAWYRYLFGSMRALLYEKNQVNAHVVLFSCSLGRLVLTSRAKCPSPV